MKHTPGIQFKFVNDNGSVQGFAAIFGERDLVGDVIERGAFAKTLANLASSPHRLPMLLAHSQDEVIGHWTDLIETTEGLWARGSINEHTEAGRDALSLVRRGDLSGLSIGYLVDGREQRADVTVLTELRLLEISLVAVPASPRARISLKDMPNVGAFAEFLHASGVTRREAEFVARKSWSAVSGATEIDYERLTSKIEATIAALRNK